MSAPAKELLVIEDDSVTLELLSYIFSLSDYNVTQVTTAEKALTLLEKTNYDLITLDLVLPGMDGNQFLDALSRQHSHIPVVIISASPKKVVARAYPHVEAVIDKPFDLTNLLNIVEKSLE